MRFFNQRRLLLFTFRGFPQIVQFYNLPGTIEHLFQFLVYVRIKIELRKLDVFIMVKEISFFNGRPFAFQQTMYLKQSPLYIRNFSLCSV